MQALPHQEAKVKGDSSEYLQEILILLRRRTQDSIHIFLVDDSARARALGFCFQLRAQVVHVGFAGLDLS